MTHTAPIAPMTSASCATGVNRWRISIQPNPALMAGIRVKMALVETGCAVLSASNISTK